MDELPNFRIIDFQTDNSRIYPSDLEKMEEFAKGFTEALEKLHNRGLNDVHPGSTNVSLKPMVPPLEFSMGSLPIDFESTNLNMWNLEMPAIEPYIFSVENLAQPTSSVTVPSATLESDANDNYSKMKPTVTTNMEQYTLQIPFLFNQDSNDLFDCPMSNAMSNNWSSPMDSYRTHGSSPASSPVAEANIGDQENIRLEIKRQKNRLAANKCRQRKVEKIERLEEKKKKLKNENSALSSSVMTLREEVTQLKEEVIHHVRRGCQLRSATYLHSDK